MTDQKDQKKIEKPKDEAAKTPVTQRRFRLVDTSRYTSGRTEKRISSSKSTKLGYF